MDMPRLTTHLKLVLIPRNSDKSLLVGHHERVISSEHPMWSGCCGQTVVYVSIQKYVCKHTFFLWQEQASKQPYIYKRSFWLLCAKTGAVADGWWRRDADLNFKWTCLLWPRTSNTYKTKQNCIPQVLTSSNCIHWKGGQSVWCRFFVVCQTSNAFLTYFTPTQCHPCDFGKTWFLGLLVALLRIKCNWLLNENIAKINTGILVS